MSNISQSAANSEPTTSESPADRPSPVFSAESPGGSWGSFREELDMVVYSLILSRKRTKDLERGLENERVVTAMLETTFLMLTARHREKVVSIILSPVNCDPDWGLTLK